MDCPQAPLGRYIPTIRIRYSPIQRSTDASILPSPSDATDAQSGHTECCVGRICGCFHLYAVCSGQPSPNQTIKTVSKASLRFLTEPRVGKADEQAHLDGYRGSTGAAVYCFSSLCHTCLLHGSSCVEVSDEVVQSWMIMMHCQ